MKKATISIQFEQEKLRALQFYAAKKGSSLEAELDGHMARLYEKHVPAQTREYIERVPEGPSKPDRPARSAPEQAGERRDRP